jgi:glycosyltransferase involved in cell wall biosynthesis
MILTEAMAAGRPFVSTPTGGVATLADGGTLVPVGEQAILADAIVSYLEDPDKAQSIGLAGQAYCETHMSPSAIGDRLRTIYSRR